tara:strand:- start:225 stop:398 length:174 start_codon:yes stop_codon:yes gene_type:complete
MFKVGDRVTRDKVLKVENPEGTVEKITADYVVVKWDSINGHWHYTEDQAKLMKHVVD